MALNITSPVQPSVSSLSLPSSSGLPDAVLRQPAAGVPHIQIGHSRGELWASLQQHERRRPPAVGSDTFNDPQNFQTEPELFQAAASGDTAMLSQLLEDNADPDAVDREGFSVLAHAVAADEDEVVQMLVDAVVNVNARDPHQRTALHIAVEGGNLGPLDILLRTPSIEVDASDENGATPLLLAVQAGVIEMIGDLLEAGADPTLQNNNGVSPLDMALQSGDTQIMSLFMAYTAGYHEEG